MQSSKYFFTLDFCLIQNFYSDSHCSLNIDKKYEYGWEQILKYIRVLQECMNQYHNIFGCQKYREKTSKYIPNWEILQLGIGIIF